MTLGNYMALNAEVCRRFTEAFSKTFYTSLRYYWNNLTGFDIVAFDEEVLVIYEDGYSMNDIVRERYGEEAVALILTLIEPFCFLKEETT